MCIICEAVKLGVTRGELQAAHTFSCVSERMIYTLVVVAGVAAMSADDYYTRRQIWARIRASDDADTARTFAAIGVDKDEYAADQIMMQQSEWVECLHVLLHAFVNYCMLYTKHYEPLSVIEGVLELAGQRLSGEASASH